MSYHQKYLTVAVVPLADIYGRPPAGAEKPERSGGFLVPLAGLVNHCLARPLRRQESQASLCAKERLPLDPFYTHFARF